VVLLSRGEQAIDLDGWVTMHNTSGTTYPDALLKLVAGDLQQLPQPGFEVGDMLFEAERAAAAEPVEQREFFEYHLCEVPRPVTLRDKENKQIEFVSAGGLPAADLPKGRVRVYQEDVDGAALLIGEDAIDHTPEGEPVRLYVGDAFDLVGSPASRPTSAGRASSGWRRTSGSH
jgi:hypothetical protein